MPDSTLFNLIAAKPDIARGFNLSSKSTAFQIELATHALHTVGPLFLREFSTDVIYSPSVIKEYYKKYKSLLICEEYLFILTNAFVTELLMLDMQILYLLPPGPYNITQVLSGLLSLNINNLIFTDIVKLIAPVCIHRSICASPPNEDEKMRVLKSFIDRFS